MQPEPPLGSVAEDDVTELRHPPLQALQVLAVVAELDDVVRLRGEPKLSVDDLVAVVAEVGRDLDPTQEVGVADELAVEEGGLIDDVRSGAHRGERLRLRTLISRDAALRAPELHDAFGKAFRETLEMAPFVLLSLAPQNLGLGVVRIGSGEHAAGDERLELRQPPALDVVVEIARRIDVPSLDLLHGIIVAPSYTGSCRTRVPYAWQSATAG